MKLILNCIVGVLLFALGACLVLVLGDYAPRKGLGSIIQSQEYLATSTPTFAGGASWTDQVLKLGSGALGSIIVTAVGTEKFILYDATSTGSLTTGNFDHRNRVLAHLETSQATGTYVYDVGFTYGLLLDHLSGTTGTTTITFR